MDGNLWADVRRINVALTRAQRKLVLIGSSQMLATVPVLKELLALIESHGWLLRLPAT